MNFDVRKQLFSADLEGPLWDESGLGAGGMEQSVIADRNALLPDSRINLTA